MLIQNEERKSRTARFRKGEGKQHKILIWWGRSKMVEK